MSDEPPLRGQIGSHRKILFGSWRHAFKVGKKCVVKIRSDGWLCAHGLDKSRLDLEGDIDPKLLYEPDMAQARVYYHPGGKVRLENDLPEEEQIYGDGDNTYWPVYKTVKLDPDALVVTSPNLPFKSSVRGMTPRRSKSFTQDRTPVPGVLLLYALKTKKSRDRITALSAFLEGNQFPHRRSSPKETEKTSELSGDADPRQLWQLIDNEESYKNYLGRMIVESACQDGAMTDWKLWEQTASEAFKAKQERIEKYKGDVSPDLDAKLLLAIRETAIEHGGLPCQRDVENYWKKLGGHGDHKQIKKRLVKLGFDWLPSHADWKRDWLPLRRKLK